jgi:D-xylose transport system permease protein
VTTVAATPERDVRRGASRSGSSSLDAGRWRVLVLLGFTAVVWIVFNALTDGVFLTARNLSNLTVQVSITGLVAIGMTYLLIAREIDLSVGSIVGVVTVLTVYVQVRHGWHMVPAIGVGLAVGAAVGALQGLLVARWRIPSFIVTLGAFSYLRGVAYVVSGAVTLSGTSGGFYEIANGTLPTSATLIVGLAAIGFALWTWLRSRWRVLGDEQAGGLRSVRAVDALSLVGAVGGAAVLLWAYTSYRGLPYPVAILAVVVLAALFVSRSTAFGRHVYAIGGNPEAARRAGVPVERTIIVLFILVGLLSAVGGIVQASRLDAGPPQTGLFLALDAISAAIIGGTSLFGGHGSVVGTLLGTILLGTVLNGLSLMGVDTYYQYITIGLVLLVAVAVDGAAQRGQRHG